MKKRFAVILAINLALTGCMFINNGIASNPGTTTTKPGTINPVIKSLTANPTSLSQPGQSISIQVDAYDPKGENLRYTWSATGGTLSTTAGTLVNWQSPNVPATYTILVVVTNDSGGTAAGNLNVQVNSDGTSTVSNSTINNSGTPSSDAGSNQQSTLDWALVSPGIAFSDAYFVSQSSGWVVGGTNGTNGKVRHTTDGGRSWQNQDIGDRGLAAVHFLTASLGWVGGYGGRLYKTTDGGATWTARTFGSDSLVKGLYFTDATHGFLVASNDAGGLEGIFTTSDGGESWTRVYDSSFDFISGALSGAIFSASSRFQDGGMTEMSPTLRFAQISPAPGQPSSLLGILSDSTLYQSTDGGATWVKRAYQVANGSIYETRSWAGIGMISHSEALGLTSLGLNGNEIVDTADGGATWNVLAVAKLTRNEESNGVYPRSRLFAFDRHHGWVSNYSSLGNKQLLRIGSL